MIFKFSNLNSNLALTLGYLNPDLNNSAQGDCWNCLSPLGDLRPLRTFSIRPLINYGGNTKMSLSSDFSKHQGDIIFSVLGGKLQKSLLQFSYPVMNNEPTRVTEGSSTLIGLVIASRVELIKKLLNWS